MSPAYFIQPANVGVKVDEVAGAQDKTIASLELPAGSYVIIAKFEVAARFDFDARHRLSSFGLAFAGTTDLAYCDLQPDGLDTVVLTIAGTLSLSSALAGAGPLSGTARLYCTDTYDDLEIKHIAMTAIPVDAISA